MIRHILDSIANLEAAEATLDSLLADLVRWRAEHGDMDNKSASVKGAWFRTQQGLVMASQQIRFALIQARSLKERFNNEVNLVLLTSPLYFMPVLPSS